MNAEIKRLWETYCTLRDHLIARHHECLKAGVKTPRNIWLFSVGRDRFRKFNPPPHQYPKHQERWLKQAIRRCEKAIEFPDSLPN